MTLQISGKQILCEGDIYKISSESKYIVTNFCRIMGFFSTLKLNNVLIDKISDYSYDDSNTQHFFRQINLLFFFQAICLLLSVANFGWFFSQIGKFERLNAFFLLSNWIFWNLLHIFANWHFIRNFSVCEHLYLWKIAIHSSLFPKILSIKNA